ncbi:MAG: sensor histidine kinase [Prevotella sp.]
MNDTRMIWLHVTIWFMLYITPLTFLHQGNDLKLEFYAASLLPTCLQMVVFYANYIHLTPKYLLGGKKNYFWLLNTILILVLGVVVHLWMNFMHRQHFEGFEQEVAPHALDRMFFFLRDIFNLAVTATVACAIVLAERWQKSEAARNEAELKNLRAQIKPHFLLNTLNNIYALITLDKKKAQWALMELSKLLRHILYNNQQQRIPLDEETDFLTSYINLMKIRLPNEVDISLKISNDNPEAKIAPMLLISLVENAFKHGVSTTSKSFIHIEISADKKKTTCVIDNSNFPKGAADKSGHGIGLAQVEKRLQLCYPGKHTWEHGVTPDNTYHSAIMIEND